VTPGSAPLSRPNPPHGAYHARVNEECLTRPAQSPLSIFAQLVDVDSHDGVRQRPVCGRDGTPRSIALVSRARAPAQLSAESARQSRSPRVEEDELEESLLKHALVTGAASTRLGRSRGHGVRVSRRPSDALQRTQRRACDHKCARRPLEVAPQVERQFVVFHARSRRRACPTGLCGPTRKLPL